MVKYLYKVRLCTGIRVACNPGHVRFYSESTRSFFLFNYSYRTFTIYKHVHIIFTTRMENFYFPSYFFKKMACYSTFHSLRIFCTNFIGSVMIHIRNLIRYGNRTIINTIPTIKDRKDNMLPTIPLTRSGAPPKLQALSTISPNLTMYSHIFSHQEA